MDDHSMNPALFAQKQRDDENAVLTRARDLGMQDCADIKCPLPERHDLTTPAEQSEYNIGYQMEQKMKTQEQVAAAYRAKNPVAEMIVRQSVVKEQSRRYAVIWFNAQDCELATEHFADYDTAEMRANDMVCNEDNMQHGDYVSIEDNGRTVTCIRYEV